MAAVPETSQAGYIDPSARMFGRIVLGRGSSVWPFVSMRAEIGAITIGDFSNVQDHSMLHIGYSRGIEVGRYCSVAHGVTLHGCQVGDACLIGIRATVMDECVIGRGSIVGGHSFVREGTIIPPFSIVTGTPAKVVRQYDARIENVLNALMYHRNGLAYAAGRHDCWSDLDRPSLQQEAESTAAGLADADAAG